MTSEGKNSLPPGVLPASVWLALIVAAGISGYLAGRPGNSPVADPVHRSSGALRAASTGVDSALSPTRGVASLNANTVSDIAARAGESVVHIEIAIKPPTNKNKCPYFFGPQSHPLPDIMTMHGQYASAAGVIIREDGYVLTNAHVVRGADEIKVTLADGREYMAERVGQDDATDLALIKIKAGNLPFARFGDSNKVRPGQWAIAIGSPFHLRHSVSLGIVSALDRAIGDPFGGLDLLQTDAAINPGNSGGPLLNLEGEVIGINCVVRSDAQNISFAVPSLVAREVADALLQHRQVEHSYIGVKLQSVLRESLSDGEPRVIITFAEPDGPAWHAGIRSGDMIRTINGKSAKSVYEVQKAVNRSARGDILQLTIVQGGKDKNVSIKVAAQSQSGSSD